MKIQIYTSESTSLGHSDKVCDLIADSILDECLKEDKKCKSCLRSNGNGEQNHYRWGNNHHLQT